MDGRLEDVGGDGRDETRGKTNEGRMNRADQPPDPVEWFQESYTVREKLEAQTYSEHAIERWVMGRIASYIPEGLTFLHPRAAYEGCRSIAPKRSPCLGTNGEVRRPERKKTMSTKADPLLHSFHTRKPHHVAEGP
eukprot:scaffold86_cov338-Pavlova_lutheri.AAC.114